MADSVAVFMSYGVLFLVALGLVNELAFHDWHFSQHHDSHQ